MRTNILFLLPLFVLVGCVNDPPNATSFTGRSGGCGFFHVYRYSPDYLSAVSLRVMDDSLELPNGDTSIAITSDSKAIRLVVEEFSAPAPTYYCDDVGGDPDVETRWRAISGQLNITISGKDASDTLSWSQPYSVSVVMNDVVLENESTHETSRLSEVKIENAGVGWLPG